MDTLKNFFIGLVIVVLSFILLGLVFITWPILIGISSLILTVVAAILFLILIFYIIVLIGYAARQLMRRS
ncbi:MAG: hypothetical protein P9L88_04450 [Candidatus Tantalella remota]|nr:hypothetical protein [Candidatus Tantalella remota]